MTILAIDLGTSALKIMRVDSDLRVLATDRIATVGMNPNEWLSVLRDNQRLHGDGGLIRKISVTGQMHGLMTWEGTGYGEGIPWTDQRGASMLPLLDKLLGADVASRIGGTLASGFQIASLAWIKRHDVDRWKRVRRIMLPKDALVHALTGKHVTDPSDAAGTGMLDVARSAWAWDIVDAVGVPRDWLPDIVPSGSEVGTVRPTIATELGLGTDVPVVIAGGDAPVGAVGSGVLLQGQALLMLSSGAQIVLPSETYIPDAAGRWYTWPSAVQRVEEGARYLRLGTLLNSGIATDWLRSILRDADTIAPEPTALIALPHLIGERPPLNNSGMRGALLGLTLETGTGEISRAMLEGIAYSVRHVLDVMCEENQRPHMVRLGGGGAQNNVWQGILTNVLGIMTERIATTDLSAYGAAALAAGMGVPIASSHRLNPDPDLVARYERRYTLYRKALDAVTPISQCLLSLKRDEP